MPPVTESLCHFSNDLYGQVIKSQQGSLKNVFVSPLSIYSAMAMVLAGSGGSTRAQMMKAMKLSETMSDDEVHKSIGPVLKQFFESTSGVSVSIANRLYVEKSASIELAYRDCVKKYYQADCEQVDFAGASEIIRKAINQWICDHTMKKIPELLSQGSIGPDTASVMANALYFKGQWNKCFNKSHTQPAEFIKHDGSIKKVQLMYVMSTFYTTELQEDEATAIKLAFLESKWSMLIILPFNHDGLPKTLSMIQKPGRLHQILTSTDFYEENMEVRVPRFKLSEDVDVNATELLQGMGMVDLFSKGLADLSGLCKQAKLCLSEVRHKAILEVDEEGATAAAATAGIAVFCSLPPSFTVLHPFIVALVYDEHTPVFIGHVVDPEDN